MTNTRQPRSRNQTSTNRRNQQKRRSASPDNSKFYSVGLVENNGTYKIVDTLMLQRVNQFKSAWKRVDSRNVSRALNRGTLVIK